jgi:hypothetical protein
MSIEIKCKLIVLVFHMDPNFFMISIYKCVVPE